MSFYLKKKHIQRLKRNGKFRFEISVIRKRQKKKELTWKTFLIFIPLSAKGSPQKELSSEVERGAGKTLEASVNNLKNRLRLRKERRKKGL